MATVKQKLAAEQVQTLGYDYKYKDWYELRCECEYAYGRRCHRKAGHIGPHVEMHTTTEPSALWWCNGEVLPWHSVLVMRIEHRIPLLGPYT